MSSDDGSVDGSEWDSEDSDCSEEAEESEDSADSGATLESVGKLVRKRNLNPVIIAEEKMFDLHPIISTQMVLVVRESLNRSKVGTECGRAGIEAFKTCIKMS